VAALRRASYNDEAREALVAALLNGDGCAVDVAEARALWLRFLAKLT
jgi:hypothetical protein